MQRANATLSKYFLLSIKQLQTKCGDNLLHCLSSSMPTRMLLACSSTVESKPGLWNDLNKIFACWLNLCNACKTFRFVLFNLDFKPCHNFHCTDKVQK